MKNSTKYLFAAILVLLTSLTAYNMALRAEYRKGDYKNPLRGYVSLDYKNFTEIAVPAAHAVSVKVVPGPFSVRINPGAKQYVQLSQQGNKLVITANFPEGRHYFGPAQMVLISCPHLVALTTDATYEENGKHVITKYFQDSQPVWVQGFAQDSLTVRADRGSNIELADNKLGYLRATVGTSLGSHSKLQLHSGNQIAAADLTLGHQSELEINNVAIPKPRYHTTDSTKVILTGAALGSLAGH